MFGVVAGGFGIWAAVVVPHNALHHEGRIFGGVTAVSLPFGIIASFPRSRVTLSYTRPDMEISVQRGDLFGQKGQLVVGFSDTFDTDTTDDRIISRTSVQGQLLSGIFGGNRAELDRLLDAALAPRSSHEIVRGEKKDGKQRRYPIGTTAVISNAGRRIYCVAYSELGNDLVAKSSVEFLWRSLGRLWDAVYEHGQHEPLAVPFMGSGLARIANVDRESLIRLILLSFMARSRERLLCKELSVVVHPTDATSVNMLEVRAFMGSL